MRSASIRIIKLAPVVLLLLLCWVEGSAQQGPAISTEVASQIKSEKTSPGQPPPVATGDARYRIGPGDVLEVRVARAPELSRDMVRVDQSGMIRMPMLDVDIPAACLTEPELAQNIAKLYRKYKND